MVFDKRSTLLSKSTKSSYRPHNRTSSLYGPIRLLALINVVLCILLFNCFVISSSLQETIPSEEFDSLANCFGKIHKDFEQCYSVYTEGAKKANGHNSTVELDDETFKRLRCCGFWKIRDCLVKEARTKCTNVQAEQVFNVHQLFTPTLVAECADYKPESGKNRVDCIII